MSPRPVNEAFATAHPDAGSSGWSRGSPIPMVRSKWPQDRVVESRTSAAAPTPQPKACSPAELRDLLADELSNARLGSAQLATRPPGGVEALELHAEIAAGQPARTAQPATDCRTPRERGDEGLSRLALTGTLTRTALGGPPGHPNQRAGG